MRGSQQQGFTLLEMLIALLIFSLIGLGAHKMLQWILQAREAQYARAEAIAEAQKALWLISEDMSQMLPQSVISPYKNEIARFWRRGWANPLGLPRSNLMQVGYAMEGHALMRTYRSADKPNSQPQSQVLLHSVSDVAMQVLSSRAVQITLTLPGFGPVRRVIEISEVITP